MSRWLCFLCGKWTDRDECPNHRTRVFREPVGSRPAPPPLPPRPLIDAKGVVIPRPTMPDRWIG